MVMGHGWRAIEPIPPDISVQRSQRLNALATQWTSERVALTQQGRLSMLVEQMKNRMAIETGIIEGLYDLSEGVTKTLIIEGFKGSLLSNADTNKDKNLVIQILRDQKEAIDYTFDLVSRQRELSTSVIKGLHAMLTRNQPTTTAIDQFGNIQEVELRRGEWKQQPNNPTRPDGVVHLYCPPEHVGSEMDRLIDLYGQYQAIGVAPEVLAAWLHHRFTQIHPFQDGNGRVARLLASVVFLRANWHPLVVLRDDRPQYIDALEKADNGDLRPLITKFTGWQSRAFVQALGASRAAERQPPEHLDQILDAAKAKLAAPDVPRTGEVEDLANLLLPVAQRVCDEVAVRVSETLRPTLRSLGVWAKSSTPDNRQAYRSPRFDLARAGDYRVDLDRGSRWARVVIKPNREEDATTLLVAMAALGRSVGSLVVTCGMITKDPELGTAKTVPVCEDTFIATVQELATDEARAEMVSNFGEWVQHSLTLGLAQWQMSL